MSFSAIHINPNILRGGSHPNQRLKEYVMENTLSPTVSTLGYWSAFLASLFSIIYVIGQLAEWFDLLGSGGGPESQYCTPYISLSRKY